MSIDLSPHELAVVKLAAQGYRMKDIARLLFRSIKTVETHRSNVRRKLIGAGRPGSVEWMRLLRTFPGPT